MIKVTIQTQERMEAINNISKAILNLSVALNVATEVNITGSHISNCETGILVDNSNEIKETIIYDDGKKEHPPHCPCELCRVLKEEQPSA